MKIQNKKTKTSLVIGLSLVALLISASSLNSVIAQTATNTTQFSATEDEIPNAISQAASQMPQHSKDVTFLNIEKRVHGFSGAYVDETGKLNIYTTDSSIKSVDKSVLADYVEPYHLANGIVVKQSNHSWHKWMELGNFVTKLADDKTLGINLMGVDDKNQVYEIGFEKLGNSKIDTVNKFLTDYNIPSDMVKLVEVGKIIPVNDDTKPCNANQRHDYSPVTVNPIMGGAEIGIPGAENSWCTYTPKCTDGFVVKDSGGNFRGLTAGHCQVSGTQQYRQPYSTTPQNSNHIYPLARLVGSLISGTVKMAHSDSLLFGVGSETSGFGKIYRFGLSQVTITGKAYTQLVGDTVCSSGAGSESTRCNSVTQVGITVNGIPGQNAAGFTSIGGDSGSPVWNPNGGITVYGTVFAASGGTTYYSPTGGIEADQGVLQFK